MFLECFVPSEYQKLFNHIHTLLDKWGIPLVNSVFPEEKGGVYFALQKNPYGFENDSAVKIENMELTFRLSDVQIDAIKKLKDMIEVTEYCKKLGICGVNQVVKEILLSAPDVQKIHLQCMQQQRSDHHMSDKIE